MPTAPKPLCRHPRCPRRAVRGGYCEAHQHLTSESRRPGSAERGYDPEWVALASSHRRAAGDRCEAIEHGRRCESRIAGVHHLDPVEVVPSRRLDPTNLIGLCRSHHQRAEVAAQRIGTPPAFCLDSKPDWRSSHYRR